MKISHRIWRAALCAVTLVTSVAPAQTVDSSFASIRWHYNSNLPSSYEPGAAWVGRGLTTVLRAQSGVQWGWGALRIAPELWSAENAEIRALPSSGPFMDPVRGCCIDLPQQFGPSSAARLDPGESSLTLQGFGVRLALTSAARVVGAGPRHAILMSGDAPGYPRLEIGTRRGVPTPIGRFAFTLSAGQTGQTRWAPDRRVGTRATSFFEGRWLPLGDDRVVIGGGRFFHQDWQGPRLGDLIVPFGSLFFDAQNFGGGASDNQLLAAFGSMRLGAGTDVWAEFGLNDRQTDLREATVELEHNSAWLFGVRRRWTDPDGARWSVEATGASGRIPPIQVFRGQATFYEHTPITQGHTHRGHLLGSRLLERSGGVELRVEREHRQGTMALIAGTRDLANQLALVVEEENLRREWSLIGEWSRQVPGGVEWWARVGGIADLNRFGANGDAYSLMLGTGVSWRFAR